MKLFSKRLFISDLPPHITEENIKEKFSKYGTINSLEIKHRKQITTKNKYPTYAYVNINTDHYNLQQCFEDLAKNKWQGSYVEVQIAKENFLERLKQERESENLLKSNKKELIFTETAELAFTKTANECEKRKRLYFSTDSEDEKVAIKKKKEQSCNEQTRKFEDKSFETKSNDVKVPITNLPTSSEVSANDKNKKIPNPSDQKRLSSIIEMRKSYQLKRNAVKTALMNVDSKINNKVIFDDDDDCDKNKIKNNLSSSQNMQSNTPKKGLFEDEDSDENDKEYNFEVKEQFQGKKGKKLMQLQLKFKNDKRFAMDDRFLEDSEVSDNELEEDNVQDMKKVQESETEVTAEEKQKEMAILEGILGGKLVKNKDKSKKKSSNSLGMIRYDPTNPEHSKYILKQNQHTEQKAKKKKGEHKSTETHETEKPIVSKETFYEVKENLKQALEEDKSFSLLTLFSSNKETVNNETDGVIHDNEVTQKNLFEVKDKNPFKYDSSDENSDNEAVEQEKELNVTEDKHNGQNISLGRSRLWREPFFFKEDDYRFQEGIDFVKKFALDDKTEFKEVRRNIKEIVRAKVRNNQRKNKLFKKKLGGRRIARMKKAMKNR